METTRIALISPEIKLANTEFNAEKIITLMKEAAKNKAKVAVFPEMTVTGSTIGEIAYQRFLYERQLEAIEKIAEESKGLDMLVLLGCYEIKDGAVTPHIAVLFDGEILGKGATSCLKLQQTGDTLYMLAATKEYAGKGLEMLENFRQQSAKLGAGICYVTAGPSESTTDNVYSGQRIACYAGKVLLDSLRFEFGDHIDYVDMPMLKQEEKKVEPLVVTLCDQNPWIPEQKEAKDIVLSEMFKMQAVALARRMKHIGAKKAVLGISGGLDSTLAVLVSVEAMKLLKMKAKDVVTITMPGFGTTDHTYNNALKLMESLGTDLREISIVPAIRQHFADINHDETIHDGTYENSQARERTQILMDVAGKEAGLVVGTGDLSELALGWCTYNGDHMAMYGVNASIPKTVMQHIIKWYIEEKASNETLKKTLQAVLDTPISPELLPPDENGEIAQKTEDKVGPYELHDFFIYHTLLRGVAPDELLALACEVFKGKYEKAYIEKWQKTFYARFFTQQFKRSCSPDGPKVTMLSLSPRGGFTMPSDIDPSLWR